MVTGDELGARARGRAAPGRHALRPPRRADAGDRGASSRRTPHARGGHPGQPRRARRPDQGLRAAARPAARGRGPALLRPHRPARRRAALRRAARALRRAADTRAHRLAGAGGRAVLPGHRRHPRRGGPAPAHHHQGPHRHRARGRGARPRRARPSETRDARRRGCAHRGARRAPHRPDARHRLDHPGRAGPGDPGAAAGDPRRPGRPRHRQDRRRAAPRGLPALHPPRADRPQRRPARRAQPGVPPLHRAGAALARRDRGRDRDAGRAVPRRHSRTAEEDPRAAALKGDVRMARVIRSAIQARQRVPETPKTLRVDSSAITLRPPGRRGLAGARPRHGQAAQRGACRLRQGPAPPPGQAARRGHAATTRPTRTTPTWWPTCATPPTSGARSTCAGCP